MVIACCLFKYFPFGGLQRDFVRIAQELIARGHLVRVYTMQCEGKLPDSFEVVVVPVSAHSNHARAAQFCKRVFADLKRRPVDRVVGFNKMPGLDFYYQADTCFAARLEKKSWLCRLLPRYRTFAEFEQEVFGVGQKTRLMMISRREIAVFSRVYGTEADRFVLLPPGISRDRHYESVSDGTRERVRRENSIVDDAVLLIQIGSDFYRKGVDRTIRAIAALPPVFREKSHLFVVGQDTPDKFKALADSLGVSANVTFFAGRNDVADLLAASDVLMHPARSENTGTVILEAVAAGLACILTDACGYSPEIRQFGNGIVTDEPFVQEQLNAAVQLAVSDSVQLSEWKRLARHAADHADIYSMPQRAAELITGQ